MEQAMSNTDPATDTDPATGDLRWVDISVFEEDARNPRSNDKAVQPVAKSIKRFGFAAPVVARPHPDNPEVLVVIAGHTRLKAAEAQGVRLIPTRILPLDELEGRALMLADNKLGELADWSDELAPLVADLDDVGVKIDDLGWEPADLDQLLGRTTGQSSSTTTASDPIVGAEDRHTPELHLGDCLDILKTMPDNSVHAVVTDPPYGLSAPPDMAVVLRAWLSGETYEHSSVGFMGKDWDSFVPGPALWREAFRVLKPGAHALVFASTRTADLMGTALRLAGFEIRDTLHWLQWQGFSKSHDISKAIDKEAGASRRVVGSRRERLGGAAYAQDSWTEEHRGYSDLEITEPATEDAKRWDGWGTALKPSVEPILLARKPLSERTAAANVVKHGTGALNVDGCRFAPGDPLWPGPQGEDTRGRTAGRSSLFGLGGKVLQTGGHPLGRWPANVLYCPKVSKAEREWGCAGLPRNFLATMGDGIGEREHNEQQASAHVRNNHPTLKPLRLMRWLTRLVTPPGGVVLDPFMGSGTTGIAAVVQGYRFVGIEREAEYFPIAEARCMAALQVPGVEQIEQIEQIEQGNA